jgi:hypothetical protein
VLSLILINAAGVEARPSKAMQMIEKGGQPLVPQNEEEYAQLLELGFYKKPDLPWPADAVNYRTVLERRSCHLRVWDDYSRVMPLLTGSLKQIQSPTLIVWVRCVSMMFCVRMFLRLES